VAVSQENAEKLDEKPEQYFLNSYDATPSICESV
jgi:hypothetical protein